MSKICKKQKIYYNNISKDKILILKIIMKKTIIIFLIMLAVVGISNANDCNSVVNDTDWISIITKNRNFDNILPKKAFEKAVENLQIFCCKISQEGEYNYCNNVDKSEYVPSSTYLLDHILDVSIRRLDAKEKNENGEDLIYGLDPDPIGKERRTFITEQWNLSKWSVPLTIVNQYKKHWKIDNVVLDRLTSNSNIPRNEETFKDYKERTLKERYNWVCESSIFIYTKKISDGNKLDPGKLYDTYNKCKSLIDTRIKKENEYTNTIISQKWGVLLHTNVNSYLDKYFLQNKILELQQLIFNVRTVFAEINKSIIELVPKCS